MNINSFKPTVFLTIVMLWSSFALSQGNSKTIPNSFVIHGNLTSEKLDFYTRSIEAADFEQYRLRDANVELSFSNGFKLELISAKNLTVLNKLQNVNPNLYKEKSSVPSNYAYPVFQINDAGWIMAQFSAQEVKIKKQ